MQTILIYQLDAFTSKLFSGNPAAVCPLDSWLPDETMRQIAKENNLAETAFYVKEGDSYFIRWFTPDIEIDLCGHATLAAASVIIHKNGHSIDEVVFNSQSGQLKVRDKGNGLLELDFPMRKPVKVEINETLRRAFNHVPTEAGGARDLVLLFENEDQIRTIEPNLSLLKDLPYLCICVTAPGKNHDFVSRVFDANATQHEDPVTGSAHCTLAPFWAERLGKKVLKAAQLSARGGELVCEVKDDRVLIGGKAVLYMKGEIFLYEC